MNCIITTAINPSISAQSLATEIANQLDSIYVTREGNSLEALKANYQVDVIIVITKKGLIAHTPSGEFFFHLSMADLRIKNLINGKHDHMVSAMDLKSGMSVLDCTLGLASDAVVASYLTGTSGNVVGLEASPIISLLAAYGLKNYPTETEEIRHALHRITVINTDYYDYLCSLPENSFDIVYFDPMFRRPIDSSSNIKPLRFLADNQPLSLNAVQEATRVAKKRVVIKETRFSKVFDELNIKYRMGGKYSSIEYGVIYAGSEK